MKKIWLVFIIVAMLLSACDISTDELYELAKAESEQSSDAVSYTADPMSNPFPTPVPSRPYPIPDLSIGNLDHPYFETYEDYLSSMTGARNIALSIGSYICGLLYAKAHPLNAWTIDQVDYQLNSEVRYDFNGGQTLYNDMAKWAEKQGFGQIAIDLGWPREPTLNELLTAFERDGHDCGDFTVVDTWPDLYLSDNPLDYYDYDGTLGWVIDDLRADYQTAIDTAKVGGSFYGIGCAEESYSRWAVYYTTDYHAAKMVGIEIPADLPVYAPPWSEIAPQLGY